MIFLSELFIKDMQKSAILREMSFKLKLYLAVSLAGCIFKALMN